MSVSELSSLALTVWQHGLRERGATLFQVVARLERAGFTAIPPDVSIACRALVCAGFADKSALGYRCRKAYQPSLLEERRSA